VTATFWTVAALLCGVAILILLVPIWRHRKRGGSWSLPGVAASVLIAPAAIGLYLYVSNWDAELAVRVSRETELLEQLARHLESNPNDLEGWRLLAASNMQLGRYVEGRAAYERVWALTRQPDDELKLAYAEAQILADRSTVGGEAGRLVEEVLEANPGNPKALWYGGLVALELGLDDAVRTRWTRLLALNPPDDVARVVQTQLAALDGGEPAEGAAGAPVPVGPEIKLSVTLAPELSLSDLGPAAQLFIIAREAEGTPPIAVIRQPPSALPGEFSLSDANSMIQGRSLSAYPEITVVARLSRSGQPTAQPGDWQAEAVVRPGDPETVALVIDEVVQ
jgi:cytochrome c-type biogenesis protein CcmH